MVTFLRAVGVAVAGATYVAGVVEADTQLLAAEATSRHVLLHPAFVHPQTHVSIELIPPFKSMHCISRKNGKGGVKLFFTYTRK